MGIIIFSILAIPIIFFGNIVYQDSLVDNRALDNYSSYMGCYQGWSYASARDDFRSVYKGDLTKLEVSKNCIGDLKVSKEVKPTITPTTKRLPTSNQQIDCIGPDYKTFLATEKKCKEYQAAWNFTPPNFNNSSDTNIKNPSSGNTYRIPTYTPIPNKPLIDCIVTYPCTGNSFKYQLDQQTCNTFKSRAIEGCPAQPTVTSTTYSNTSSNTTKEIDTTGCYNQYNDDVQRATTYGGNVGDAMKDIAKNNLNSCLVSGNITSVGTVSSDTRPRDRNGKLCSEYGPELESFSKSMGCP